MSNYWKKWIHAAIVRAVRTMAQAAAAAIGTTALVQEVDWLVVGGTALVSGILSLLTSLGGLPEVNAE